jgi:hypothetical protein
VRRRRNDPADTATTARRRCNDKPHAAATARTVSPSARLPPADFGTRGADGHGSGLVEDQRVDVRRAFCGKSALLMRMRSRVATVIATTAAGPATTSVVCGDDEHGDRTGQVFGEQRKPQATVSTAGATRQRAVRTAAASNGVRLSPPGAAPPGPAPYRRQLPGPD